MFFPTVIWQVQENLPDPVRFSPRNCRMGDVAAPVFRVTMVISGSVHGPLISIDSIYAEPPKPQPARVEVSEAMVGSDWQVSLVAVLALAATPNPSATLARIV